MIITEPHAYICGEKAFEGVVVRDDSFTGTRPGVLLAHAMFGLGHVEATHARRLAALGYVVFACDYYGTSLRPDTREEAVALMGSLNSDRGELLRRMQACLAELAAFDFVDAGRLAAIGFCFGGKAVLDLSRSGAGVAAVISVHGVYDPPNDGRTTKRSSVLVLHGWNDPLSPPEALMALTAELDETCTDWQFVAFGNTSHAFTHPEANMPVAGIQYSQRAAHRSWYIVDSYLNEKVGLPDQD